MNDKKILLLEKLIQLTNDGVLTWEIYEDSSLSLNPVQKSLFSNTLLDAFMNNTLLPSRSYVTCYKAGYIGLFAYSHMAFNATVELILQSSDNAIPQLVAASDNENKEIAFRVKRLYNLIDLNSETTDITDYMDDIIND